MVTQRTNQKIDKRILCILDANYNRSKEGLRVVEDMSRFLFKDKKIMYVIKSIRHGITNIFSSRLLHDAICQRDSFKDIGRSTDVFEMKRSSKEDVLYANMQRIKEGLRVLEELLKIIDKKKVSSIKVLRYKAYELEKALIKKRYSLRHS